MNAVNVLIADRHWLARRGLQATVRSWEGFEVVGEAADVPDCLALATRSQPDLVLLDAGLAGEGGIAATRLLKERLRQVRVLLLADPPGDDMVREALRAQADGCLRKDAGEHDLREAVSSVLQGRVFLDAELMRELVLADHRRECRTSTHPLDCLSPRELAVFRLVAEGHTNRTTGERLQLSPKTVEKYRAALMQKLRLRTAVDLRVLALELGIGARTLNA